MVFGKSFTEEVNLSIDFQPQYQRWAVKPHDVMVSVNGHEVGRLVNEIPEGTYSFTVDPAFLNTSTDGGAVANTVHISTKHMNGGHYVVAASAGLCSCVPSYSELICANSESEAQGILQSRPYLRSAPNQLQVQFTEPAEGALLNKNEPVTVSVNVTDQNGGPFDAATLTFSACDGTSMLLGNLGSGVYGGIWTPTQCGNGCGLSISAGACGISGTAQCTVDVSCEGPSVSGRIVEDDGLTPVQGATVRLKSAGGLEVGSTLTTSTGSYSFFGIAAGEGYVIEVVQDGYITHRSSALSLSGTGQVLGDFRLFRVLIIGSLALRSETMTDIDEHGNKYRLERNVVVGAALDRVMHLACGISSSLEVDVGTRQFQWLGLGDVTFEALGAVCPITIDAMAQISLDADDGTFAYDGSLHSAMGSSTDIELAGSLTCDFPNHKWSGIVSLNEENHLFDTWGKLEFGWDYGLCSAIGFRLEAGRTLKIGHIIGQDLAIIDGILVFEVEMKSSLIRFGGALDLFKLDLAGLGYSVTTDELGLNLKVKGLAGVSGVVTLNLKTMGLTVERDLSVGVTVPIPASNQSSQDRADDGKRPRVIPIIVDVGLTLNGQEEYDDADCDGLFDPGETFNDEDSDGVWDEGTSLRLRDDQGNWGFYAYGSGSVDLALYKILNFQVAEAEVRLDFPHGRFQLTGAVGPRLGDLFRLQTVTKLDLDLVNQIYEVGAEMIPQPEGILPSFQADFTVDLANQLVSGTIRQGFVLFGFVSLQTQGASFRVDQSGLSTAAWLSIAGVVNADAVFVLTGEGISGRFTSDFSIGGHTVLGQTNTFEVKNGCFKGEGDVPLFSCAQAKASFEYCRDWWWPTISVSHLGLCILSPVNVRLTDAQGRHTGIGVDGRLELEIPGSWYQQDGADSHKAIMVAMPDLDPGFTAELLGIADGEFSLEVIVPDPLSNQTVMAAFRGRPVSPTTRGILRLSRGVPLLLQLDGDGDGTHELQYEPDSIVTLACSEWGSPQISQVRASQLSADCEEIEWWTDVPTTGNHVQFGTSIPYTDTTDFDSLYSLEHRALLCDLKTDTVYHFRAFSSDSTGFQTSSLDLTFVIRAGLCGVVQGASGDAVPGARLEAWTSFPDGSVIEEASTNSAGSFCLPLPAGAWDLRIFSEGYCPEVVRAARTSTDQLTVSLTPLPFDSLPNWPYRADYFSVDATFEEEGIGYPLLPGDVILATDPQGVYCGMTTITKPGEYMIHVLGDDPSTPTDEGASPGDKITLWLNCTCPAVAPQPWTNGVFNNLFDVDFTCTPPGVDLCGLCEGWNMISFNIRPDNDSLTAVLASLDSNYDRVASGTCGYGPRTWERSRPAILNDLTQMSPDYGYEIHLSQSDTLSLSGQLVPADDPIPLCQGWNAIPYLPVSPDTLPHALASIAASYRYIFGMECGYGVRTWDAQRPAILNDLYCLEPCKGYWINLTQPDTLVYPTSGYECTHVEDLAGAAKSSVNISRRLAVTPHFADYWSTADPSVTGIREGDVITARTPAGLICGECAAGSNGNFLIHVYGDDPKTPTVEGARAGEKVTFEVNGEPAIVAAGNANWSERASTQVTLNATATATVPTEYALLPNYPNPFNAGTIMPIALKEPTDWTLTIYNVMGQEVRSFDGHDGAGIVRVTWDGTADNGAPVSSGIYFYRVTTPEWSASKKMTLVK